MKYYSREKKAKWLEGWNRSGKSMSAYARESGIAVYTETGLFVPGYIVNLFIFIPDN
jgi:hypothetical protein